MHHRATQPVRVPNLTWSHSLPEGPPFQHVYEPPVFCTHLAFVHGTVPLTLPTVPELVVALTRIV
jgi:hypothetical protein